ncbi:hypothetical protein [uncultured Aquabacterium sp.]|uniref:hypothetical protein n=1 Tax=uncultured Aquabacterium sp. TaxID=158753 RepID=UPI0025EDAEC4|nr:hypothetical protein [uncultured Aquabacterium sp.]
METVHAPSAWRRSRVMATVACALGLMAAIWAGFTGHLPMAAVLSLSAALLLPRSLLGRGARRQRPPSAPAADQSASKPDWRRVA